MVQIESCNCAEMDEEEIIDTWQKFKKAREYFETQVKQGVFEEEKVNEPFYTWDADLWKGEWGSVKRYTNAASVVAYGNLNTLIFRLAVLSESSKTENTFQEDTEIINHCKQ